MQEHYNANIFYNFKVRLNLVGCLQHLTYENKTSSKTILFQWLHLTYEDKTPSQAIVFRWFAEFRGYCISFPDKRQCVSHTQKLIDFNLCVPNDTEATNHWLHSYM